MLVTAKLGGVYSSNTASSKVTVAVSDPQIRDDVTVVGLFIPSANVEIAIIGDRDAQQHGVTFSGSVAIEAQNLVPGNIITGLSSDFLVFARRVVEITQASPDFVELVVSQVPLDEIFSELHMDGTFEASLGSGVLDDSRRLFSSW